MTIVDQSTAGRVLMWVTLLCFAVILILAFSVIIARQNTINKLREQVDTLFADRVDEQLVENCRHLYEADLYFASAAYTQAEGALVIALASGNDVRRDAAVKVLERRTNVLNAAVGALQGYVAAPDPPGRCAHPTAIADRNNND